MNAFVTKMHITSCTTAVYWCIVLLVRIFMAMRAIAPSYLHWLRRGSQILRSYAMPVTPCCNAPVYWMQNGYLAVHCLAVSSACDVKRYYADIIGMYLCLCFSIALSLSHCISFLSLCAYRQYHFFELSYKGMLAHCKRFFFSLM